LFHNLFRMEYFRGNNRLAIDAEVLPFLEINATGGWLKKAREGSQMSIRGVAKKMGVAHSLYWTIEAHEDDASIKMMRRCAEAMDCEFVYAIRPKSRQLFSERIWMMVQHFKWPRRWLYDAKFRREHGLGRNSGLDWGYSGLSPLYRAIRKKAWNAVKNPNPKSPYK